MEAMHYTKGPKESVICSLCPIKCRIRPGDSGRCRSRRNEGGTLVVQNYGAVTAVNIDPIEKKPLYHFLPGTDILSLGNNGCNLQCRFCQNWQISQTNVATQDLQPSALLAMVQKRNLQSVAFTYAEPSIWFEYVLDCSRLLKQNGIKSVLVSNGYIEPEPLEELLPSIDAMNIDIKSMDEEFYRKLCAASLSPVLKTCETVRKHCHLEITNLIIPSENDSLDLIEKLVRFMATNLGDTTPLHLSRYYPGYQMTQPPTPEQTILDAGRLASEMLKYVYLGNLRTPVSNDTVCHHCNAVLITRSGYRSEVTGLDVTGRCLNCNADNNVLL